MTIESDVHALLVGYAPLSAIVGSRVALAAVPPGDGYPLVVFLTTHDYVRGLTGGLLGDICSINVQCWAETATGASAVADAVEAAFATRADAALITSRAPTFDEESGLDGVVIAVTWIP